MSRTNKMRARALEIHKRTEALELDRRALHRDVLKALPELLLEHLMAAQSATVRSMLKHLEAMRILVSSEKVEETLELLRRQKRARRDGDRYLALQPEVLNRHLSETPKPPSSKKGV